MDSKLRRAGLWIIIIFCLMMAAQSYADGHSGSIHNGIAFIVFAMAGEAGAALESISHEEEHCRLLQAGVE
jgi:hypothetical protein